MQLCRQAFTANAAMAEHHRGSVHTVARKVKKATKAAGRAVVGGIRDLAHEEDAVAAASTVPVQTKTLTLDAFLGRPASSGAMQRPLYCRAEPAATQLFERLLWCCLLCPQQVPLAHRHWVAPLALLASGQTRLESQPHPARALPSY